MIKQYHIPAISFFLLCCSFALLAQSSVYSFPFENSYRLAPMESYINTEEISATYQTRGNLYTTEITGMGEQTMEQTSTTTISDVKAVDAVRFLEFYLTDQLLMPGDTTSGAVEMSIIYFNKRSRANLGTVIDILSLGIGAFLGIPYATSITDVEVEAVFFKGNDQLLCTQRGVGRSKALESLYNQGNLERREHQKALKRAISDLNGKIMADPALQASRGPVIIP